MGLAGEDCGHGGIFDMKVLQPPQPQCAAGLQSRRILSILHNTLHTHIHTEKGIALIGNQQQQQHTVKQCTHGSIAENVLSQGPSLGCSPRYGALAFLHLEICLLKRHHAFFVLPRPPPQRPTTGSKSKVGWQRSRAQSQLDWYRKTAKQSKARRTDRSGARLDGRMGLWC